MIRINIFGVFMSAVGGVIPQATDSIPSSWMRRRAEATTAAVIVHLSSVPDLAGIVNEYLQYPIAFLEQIWKFKLILKHLLPGDVLEGDAFLDYYFSLPIKRKWSMVASFEEMVDANGTPHSLMRIMARIGGHWIPGIACTLERSGKQMNPECISYVACPVIASIGTEGAVDSSAYLASAVQKQLRFRSAEEQYYQYQHTFLCARNQDSEAFQQFFDHGFLCRGAPRLLVGENNTHLQRNIHDYTDVMGPLSMTADVSRDLWNCFSKLLEKFIEVRYRCQKSKRQMRDISPNPIFDFFLSERRIPEAQVEVLDV
jgi:hypothetical protein